MAKLSSVWRARIRWFAAEYVIVVAGVLTAVALTLWADRLQNRGQEREYLEQLESDLTRTEQLFHAADTIMAPRDSVGALFVRAYFMPVRPPQDTVLKWLMNSMWIESPGPVMGTAQALITSGDIRLIRNTAVRSALTEYVENSRRRIDEQKAFYDVWFAHFDYIIKTLNIGELTARRLTQENIDKAAKSNAFFMIPAGPRRNVFPVDVDELYNNREIFGRMNAANLAKRNLFEVRAAMAKDAASVRALIDAELRARSR